MPSLLTKDASYNALAQPFPQEAAGVLPAAFSFPSACHASLRLLLMFPSACGGSVVLATGEASLQLLDAASTNDSSRPLRSCTSRLSRGEIHHVSLRLLLMFPSACGGSVVSATGEASLQSFDAASTNDSSRPLRSCTSRLSRGEIEDVSATGEAVLRFRGLFMTIIGIVGGC